MPQLISYSDLDVDLSPTDLARRLQPLVLPEYAIHAFVFGLFLVGGYWLEAALNLPLFCWNLYSYATKQHRIDPTRVYYTIDFVNKVNTTKLIFFICCFFVYIFRMVFFIINSNFDD